MTPEQRTEWEAEVTDNRTLDGRIPLVEYRPRVLEHPLRQTGVVRS